MKPVAGILRDEDLFRVRQQFGAGDAQVRRDHIISHTLAALADVADMFVFFGGTALSRSVLPDLRLSEDIDLIAAGPKPVVARSIEEALVRKLGRTVGRPLFVPRLIDASGARPVIMQVQNSRVRLQLLSQVGYPAWPTELVDIEQRYHDAPPARLRVLTPAAFAAAKLSAWGERGAARDLYDMWALAERGYINADARDLFSRLGTATRAASISFATVPSEAEWELALGHQCMLRVSATRAADVVAAAWRASDDTGSPDVGRSP